MKKSDCKKQQRLPAVKQADAVVLGCVSSLLRLAADRCVSA